MAEAKIHPPSPSRVAEARAAGLAPLPTLAGMAGGLVALALAMRELLPQIWSALGRLYSAPLAALAAGESARAEQLARDQLSQLASTLLSCAAAVLLCVSLALVLSQGIVFVWPRRPRRPITRAKLSHLAAALWSVAACLLLAASLRDALWLSPDEVPAALSRWTTRAALAALGLGLVDAALARERFFRSLWLTRREQRDEQREAFGAPETRAARAEARRDGGGT